MAFIIIVWNTYIDWWEFVFIILETTIISELVFVSLSWVLLMSDEKELNSLNKVDKFYGSFKGNHDSFDHYYNSFCH